MRFVTSEENMRNPDPDNVIVNNETRAVIHYLEKIMDVLVSKR